MLEVVVTIVLGTWFVLSVLNQIDRGKLIFFVRRLDAVGLIPIWTFFAPNPGRTDYHLLYRDLSFEGTVSVWHEVDMNRARWFRLVWNPDRRVSKGVHDVVPQLLRPGKGEDFEKGRLIEVPYIILLNFILRRQRDFLAERRQFAIAQTDGVKAVKNPKIMFVSPLARFE